jgi:hypothetical protein
MISNTTENANNICNYISSSLSPQFHLKPAGVRSLQINSANLFSTVSLGFPWYFVQQYSAKKFLEKVISDFRMTVGIKTETSLLIDIFELYPNFPNPFSPSTKILFNLNKIAQIDIFIYNLLGEKIYSFYQGNLPTGRHEAEGNSKNNAGISQASGIYFLKLMAGRRNIVSKIILQ